MALVHGTAAEVETAGKPRTSIAAPLSAQFAGSRKIE